jgi:tetratricopeptide (TPR) repeat protein
MAHTNLGNALDAAGNLTDATPHFEAAWKLNPLYPEALNNYGRVKASQNNFSEAHALFQKAVEIKPSFIIARYNLGLTHFELGRIVDSAHEWLLVLEQQPHNQQAMQSLQFIHQHNLGQLCDQLMHSGTTAYNDFQQLWLKHLPEHPIPCFS